MLLLLENGDRLLHENGDAFALETDAAPAGLLLLETGFSLLLENGERLALEGEPDVAEETFAPGLGLAFFDYAPRRRDDEEELLSILALMAGRRV